MMAATFQSDINHQSEDDEEKKSSSTESEEIEKRLAAQLACHGGHNFNVTPAVIRGHAKL